MNQQEFLEISSSNKDSGRIAGQSSSNSESELVTVTREQYNRFLRNEREYRLLKEEIEAKGVGSSRNAIVEERCNFCGNSDDFLSQIRPFNILICHSCNESYEIKPRVMPFRSQKNSSFSSRGSKILESGNS